MARPMAGTPVLGMTVSETQPESLVACIKPTSKNLNLNKIREEYAFNRFF